MSKSNGDEGDPRRSATLRLVRSLSSSYPSSADSKDDSVEPALVRVAERILRSSIGMHVSDAAAAGRQRSRPSCFDDTRPDPAAIRRIERSYRSSPPSLSDEAGGVGVRSEAEILTATRKVEGLYRKLIVMEQARGRGGVGKANIALGVLSTLSRLVCTEGDGRAVRSTLEFDGANSATMVKGMTASTFSNREEPPNPIESNPLSSALQSIDQSFLDTVWREEVALLRECLYSLRNVDTDLLHFRRPSDEPTLHPTATGRVHGENDDDPLSEYDGVRVRPGLVSMSLGMDEQVARGGRRLLGSGAEDAMRICGEAGWLYGRVRHYIDEVNTDGDSNDEYDWSGSSGGGAVARALSSALESEMTEYHRLMAHWEAELPKESALASSSAQLLTRDLTLRSLLSQLRTPLTRLIHLASLVDGVTPAMGGGPLLSALVLSASHHGDTRRSTLLHSLASKASRPWYDMLYQWTTQGSLSDPTGAEFFVTENTAVEDGYLWHGRYVLEEAKVPLGLVDMELAVEALAVGKGINFIRRCLGDKGWELEQDVGDQPAYLANSSKTKTPSKERLGYLYDPQEIAHAACPLSYRRLSPLRCSLAQSSSSVHEHILSSIFGRHHLLEHLAALKRFLFLGQGDFVSALMDGLHHELDEKKSRGRTGRTKAKREIGYGDWDGNFDGIYAHTLMGPVDMALRTTNARFLPGYVLGRVRVELRPPESVYGTGRTKDNSAPRGQKEGKGEKDEHRKEEDEEEWTAWDAFSLAYDVDPPLTAVVHPQALELYSRIFRMLFRLRRVEFALDSAWRSHSSLRHSLQKLAHVYGNDDDVEMFGADEEVKTYRRGARTFLREAAGARQRASHFATNLRGYLMFEVLEGGWEELVRNLRIAQTLDEVVGAHDRYIATIASKCLLDNPVASNEGLQSGVGHRLRYVVSSALQYALFLEQALGEALRLADDADRKRRDAESRTERGKWGHEKFSDGGEDADGTKLYQYLGNAVLLEQARISFHKFDEGVRGLLGALDEQLNDAASNTPSSQRARHSSSAVSPMKSPVRGHSSGEQWSVDYGGSFLSSSPFGAAPGIGQVAPDFYDSLRFLAFRLDFNQYYERTRSGEAT